MSNTIFLVPIRDLINAPLMQMSVSLQNFSTSVNNTFVSIHNEINQANEAVKKFSLKSWVKDNAGTIAEKAFDGLKVLYNKGAELQQTQMRFETLTGSMGKAKNMLDEISKYSGKSPYSGEALNKSAEQMLSLGMAQDKVVPTIKMLGDVAMGNEQKFGALSESFSNVMNTGKLAGSDLSQMISQGFDPLKVISENTGISMDKLKTKMEEGAISTAMVQESFKLATTAGGEYHGVADKLAQSAGGKWNTFMNTFSDVVGRIGLKFATWISPLFDIGSTVLNSIIPLGEAIGNVIKWVSDCTPLLVFLGSLALGLGVNFVIANAATIAYTVVLGLLEGAVTLVSWAVAAFNFVMSINPIAWVIIGIGALITIIMVCWNKFAGFRAVIMGVWETVRGFGQILVDHVINRVREVVSGLTGMGRALYLLFTGDFKKAWEVGKKAVVDLSGVKSLTKLGADGVNLAKDAARAYQSELARGTTAKVTVATKSTKDKIDKVRPPQPPSNVFKDLLTDKTKKGAPVDKDITKVRSSSNSITGGGTQTSHITINLAKMQDQIVINTINAGEGATKMRQLLEEELNRLLGSITLMQTA